MTETTDHAVILKKNDEFNLYKEIKNLILDKKKRKHIQKLSRSNIKHTIIKNLLLLIKKM